MTHRTTGGSLVATLGGHRGGVLAVAIDSTGRLALTGSQDSELKLWDLDAAESAEAFNGHLGPVWGVAFTPNGRLAVTTSEDGSVGVWLISTGSLIRTFPEPSGMAHAIAVDPTGDAILVGGNEPSLVRPGSNLVPS